MSKAFVETTVLADALLKPGDRSQAATSAIRRFDESLLPVYAIKELKAGILHHYVWLHGKLVTTKSWEKTLAQLRKTAMSPYKLRWVGTAIEALEASAHKTGRTTLTTLVSKYGPLATEDSVLCDRYRYALRSIIVRGWKKRRTVTTAVVDELACYGETDLREERGLIDLGDTDCKPKNECSLAASLKADIATLRKLKDAVDSAESKPENKKRSQALRDIIRTPSQKVTNKSCRDLGDAIFAFFCPADATILSTNERDLAPLAGSIGKKVERP